MAEIHDLVQSGIEITRQMQNIPFFEVIKATTKFQFHSMNLQDPQDLEVFNEITISANNLIKYIKSTGTGYKGNRINEVGRNIELVFVEELKKSKLKPFQLTSAGYPDIKIIDSFGRVTFLESKAVSQDWESTFRSFYYTNGKKIDADARHLLIGWDVSKESGEYWVVKGWKLVDLSKLMVDTKMEFHSNNKQVYRKELILAQK